VCNIGRIVLLDRLCEHPLILFGERFQNTSLPPEGAPWRDRPSPLATSSGNLAR
jgi:hypothetical protein